MPGTGVASRKASWNRVKKKYKKHSRGWYERKEARKIQRMKDMAKRKAMGSKK